MSDDGTAARLRAMGIDPGLVTSEIVTPMFRITGPDGEKVWEGPAADLPPEYEALIRAAVEAAQPVGVDPGTGAIRFVPYPLQPTIPEWFADLLDGTSTEEWAWQKLIEHRWAAFTDDELQTLHAACHRLDGEWRSNRLDGLHSEVAAELERRREASS